MADWGIAPTILIFADGDDGMATACDSALASGGRIAAALPIAGAADRLEDQIAVDLVMLDITRDHGPLLDKLLSMIEEGAQARRFASVVTIAPDLIDIATARIAHEDVSVLVGRDRNAVDIAIGKRVGAHTILVLTGVTARDAALTAPPEWRPDTIADDLRGLFS